MHLLVLMASLIVASIGFASLQLIRLQARSANDTTSFMEARLLARSAVEIGMLKIRNDPYWRRNLGNGPWIIDQPIDQGRFSLSARDPIDDNVAAGENHPVILTGTGSKGGCTYRTSVRLEVGPRTGSCLEVSMLSGADTIVSGATLDSDQTVSANDDFLGTGAATISANVEANDTISGATYTKARAQQAVRTLPVPSAIIAEYISLGTAISYSAIPQWTCPEVLLNGTFESSMAGWSPSDACSIVRTSLNNRNGAYSLLVYNRGSSAAAAAQTLAPSGLSQMRTGHNYAMSLPIFCGADCTARATLTIVSTEGGTQTFSSSVVNVKKNKWTIVAATVTPSWSGSLLQATVSVKPSVNNDYFIDDATLTDVTFPKNSYVICNQLLSPVSNLYGTANANGVYVINCAGRDVIIADTRIIGTVVLRQPGGGTSIQRSVNWEAAVYNYPALLTEDSIQIQLSAAGLSENSVGTNFNPANAPFPFAGGSTNAEMTDSYPSKITGLIYSGNDLGFSGTTTISGVVLAHRNINVSAASLSLAYANVYLNDPPPGFTAGTAIMKVVPGTWQRSVD